jgi:demethylmenaquinone methyltransferase/2-methoxy-6-polyprenyl-1,4-benzoquinol methylase
VVYNIINRPVGLLSRAEGVSVSTYVLMKILESAPSRYDAGIRLLTLGKVDEVYDRLASHVKSEQRVLDVGCGTGALTLRAAQQGAKVKGIDVNAQMLEIAQQRVSEAGLLQDIELCEMGVAELGGEESESCDVVMSGLCFSELTEDELTYTLKEAQRILKPGGLLLVADEVVPRNVAKRILNWLTRLALVVVTYAITQTTTNAVERLPERVAEAGFLVESVKTDGLGSFMELIGIKPEGDDR